jgi:LysM repeat protein
VLVAFAAPALSAGIANADNTYTVQDGDSLFAVAARLGVPSTQVADWVDSTVKLNSLGDADDLKPGQVLKLPSSSGSASTSITQSTTTAEPASSVTASGSYKVADGDTLLGIAAKIGIPADQQLAWIARVLTLNGLSNAEQLAIGQTLRLPVDTNAPVKVEAVSATSVSPVPAGSSSTGSASSTSPGGALKGSASAYHDSFTNKPMGCTGAGLYKPADLTIIAVGPAMYNQFPCGTSIEVCGPKGCLAGVRKDACPGCLDYHVDLSRAGLTAVCGPNACEVRLRRLP